MVKRGSVSNLSNLFPHFLAVSCLLFLGIPAFCQSKGDKGKEKSEVFAVVNGSRAITGKEVDDLLGPQLQELQEKIYFIRSTATNNLVIKALLEEEARARGITVDDLKKQLIPGKVEVPKSKVDEVYEENASLFANMSQDEAKERIRLDLESHEKMAKYKTAVEELRRKAKVEMFLSAPPPLMASVGADGPAKGSADAPVTIVVFSDFQCPYCKQAIPVLNQVMQAYGNDVRLIFKHLPLSSIHPQALGAAQAAVCAEKQGRFWDYHDRLFASSPNLSPLILEKIASDIGLNTGEFSSCLNGEESRSAVLRDLQVANKLGIQGTPTFVINGQVFKEAISFESVKKIINEESHKAKKTVEAK